MRAIWRVAHMASAETKGWPAASPVVAALLVITAFAVAAGEPHEPWQPGWEWPS